jgi:beta-barrel assembly-enhancing protease
MKHVLAGLLFAALPVWADDVAPWSYAVSTGTLEREENNLWAEAEEFDKALLRSGKVRNDPALQAYLQGVMNKLYPEFGGKVRIHALDSGHLNAFALPNGSVYINTGLLARLQNEAQLAAVLAHEGAHFVHRHSYQQVDRVKNSATFALIVGMAGVPLVGDIVAISAITGFSREHETEADNIGYQRLTAAGYSAKEAPKTFEHLIAEIKALDINEPFFFASHPKLQDRVDNFNELSKDAANGQAGYEPFLLATRDLRLYTLQEDLDAYRYKQLILVLADPQRRREYPPEASYYLGEAYRLRSEEGDLEKAEREYTLSLELSPKFAPAYRALGLVHYKRGQKAQAAPLFRRYIELAPNAPDRGYIEAYLKDAGA